MTFRGWICVGFAVALLTAIGCSSNSADPVPPAPAIACSDGGAAPANGVTLTCGGTAGTTKENVNVVMGGAAAGSTTLRGLNFDVTYEPAKLEFVPASAYTSPLFPGALVAVTLEGGLPGRVVVSIQQPGGVLDVTVLAGQHDVLSLSFQRASGVSFGPTPVAFDLSASEATAASAPIAFLGSLALSYQ